MRSVRAFILGISVLLAVTYSAQATFHLMQIEQVIGGVDGDTSAQAIQLRMRSANQGSVSEARLVVRDENNANPVVLIDFLTNVMFEAGGDRILICTNSFRTLCRPNAISDFTMTAIPASYLASGTLTFEEKFTGNVVWRLSWGGANYLGPTTGTNDNDANSDFGVFAGDLPKMTLQALQFGGAFGALSNDNAMDYALTGGAAVFTNNRGCEFTVSATMVCSGGDVDNDMLLDDCDACIDSDHDDLGDPGFPDNCCDLDGCPMDPDKGAPGVCGCGVPDTDDDGDGVPNCIDACPGTPAGEARDAVGCGCSQQTADDDGDGTKNCEDACPADPAKSSTGACGCGVADTDSDNDGTPDCNDGCPSDPNKIAPGTAGCGAPEPDGGGQSTPTANCGAMGGAAGACGSGIMVITPVLLLAIRRRGQPR